MFVGWQYKGEKWNVVNITYLYRQSTWCGSVCSELGAPRPCRASHSSDRGLVPLLHLASASAPEGCGQPAAETLQETSGDRNKTILRPSPGTYGKVLDCVGGNVWQVLYLPDGLVNYWYCLCMSLSCVPAIRFPHSGEFNTWLTSCVWLHASHKWPRLISLYHNPSHLFRAQDISKKRVIKLTVML